MKKYIRTLLTILVCVLVGLTIILIPLNDELQPRYGIFVTLAIIGSILILLIWMFKNNVRHIVKESDIKNTEKVERRTVPDFKEEYKRKIRESQIKLMEELNEVYKNKEKEYMLLRERFLNDEYNAGFIALTKELDYKYKEISKNISKKYALIMYDYQIEFQTININDLYEQNKIGEEGNVQPGANLFGLNGSSDLQMGDFDRTIFYLPERVDINEFLKRVKATTKKEGIRNYGDVMCNYIIDWKKIITPAEYEINPYILSHLENPIHLVTRFQNNIIKSQTLEFSNGTFASIFYELFRNNSLWITSKNILGEDYLKSIDGKFILSQSAYESEFDIDTKFKIMLLYKD